MQDPATTPAADLDVLQPAFEGYEEVRRLLARDATQGFKEPARRIAGILETSKTSLRDAPAAIRQCLQAGRTAAESLERATSPEEARRAFGELGRSLLALGSADEDLTKGWRIFRCPMAKGFPKWFQKGEEPENPYMGPQMLRCGEPTDWTVGPPSTGDGRAFRPEEASPAAGKEGIAYYTCSMHPSVKQKAPGTCPICAMNLTPVTHEQLATGEIVIDPVRRQRIGVTTAPAVLRPVSITVRTVGILTPDESRLYEVNLRASGWAEKVMVRETGQHVRKGELLMTLYSPEFFRAKTDHLLTCRQSRTRSDPGIPLRTSRLRLELLGMTPDQVAHLESRGDTARELPILSPATGFVMEKDILEGGRVEEGSTLFRIADLDRLWVQARVYENDLRWVRLGQQATIEIPHLPGRRFTTKVVHIHPTVDEKTRTGMVRLELRNEKGLLRPGMYANVDIEIDLGERLVIPDTAVVFTGPRRLVFRDLGEGRLRPVEIEVGVQTDGHYVVTRGLEPGDIVVRSGNFLVAAESRIRSATTYWGGSDDLE